MESDNYFYVTYFNRSEISLHYPDIIMEKLLNYDIAILYYHSTVISFSGNIIEIQPILITDNENFYKQYRHVLSEIDFRAFCYDKLSNYRCLSGTDGEDAFAHFVKIKNREYNTAYQSRTTETWDDEQSGYSYDYKVNQCWKTSDMMLTSADIEDKLKKVR